MNRLLNWIERQYIWIAAAILLSLLVLAAFIIVTALPPREFTILTGREGAGYYRAAQAYRQFAEERGYTLNLQTTSGSIETLHKLEAGEASIGFIQGGITQDADPRVLSTLAGVFYEPVWIFYQRDFRSGRKLVHLYELEGGRINLGEAGSGASFLARQLLEANGVTESNSTLLELPADEAAAGLREGRLDAAIFVVGANSDTVRTLVRDNTLDLMDVQRAAAYRDRFPFLTTLVLPEGAIDVRKGLPNEDKRLIATAANLVIRNDFHPELVRLMTAAAVEVHEDGGLFEERFEFPNYDHTDLPIGREERAYLESIKRGETTFESGVPYWASALIDRWPLFAVPLALLLLVLLLHSAIIHEYFDQRKVDQCYDTMRRIDLRVPKMDGGEVRDSLAVLDNMERDLVERSIRADKPRPVFVDLRSHIALVRERLERHLGNLM